MASIPKLKVLISAATLSALLGVGSDAVAQTDEKVQLQVDLGTPILRSDRKQVSYMKVGLTGFHLRDSASMPVNIAIVLDRSSSMSGSKLQKAKEAALMVLDRLKKDDVISVIAYDSVVRVLVPATKVADRKYIRSKIRKLTSGGSTALFAGVSKGIEEVSKFFDRNRVNRIILLSDGQANVGPRSPNQLGRLGASAAKRGIAITTIGLGLGYNEDLMAQLAVKSDGNHAFVQNATELVKIFNAELGDVLTVVAQEVIVKVRLHPGARPIRVLNREAEFHGNTVILSLNQLYSRQEKFFILELEVEPGTSGSSRELGTVDVSYANLVTKKTDRLAQNVGAAFSQSLAMVERKTNRSVMVDAVEALGNATNRMAVQLRDKGQINEARTLLQTNIGFLNENALRYKSNRLKSSVDSNYDDADNLDPNRWRRQRKKMLYRQHQLDTQQSF